MKNKVMKQKHLFLSFLLVVLALPTYAQNKIGDNPTVIQSGSLLELESLTKGFRLPRIRLNDLNTWILDGIPVSGMVVFNDSGTVAKGIYYWNMDLSQWVQVVISANNGLTVTNGNVILGGALTGTTTIVTDANNTLAVTGLQAGANTDNVIVSNAGVLKAISPTALSINGDVSGTLGIVSVDKLKGASLFYSGLSDKDLLQYNKEDQVWINVSPSTLGTIGLTVGTIGNDINVSGSPASLGSSITLNIPDASESVRGVVTKDAQTFGGDKTFKGNLIVDGTNTFTVGTGATSLGGALSVTGATTLTGTTALNDDATLASGKKILFTSSDASGKNTSFTAGAQTADIGYTLPTGGPAADDVLKSTADGTLSWTSASSLGKIGLTLGTANTGNDINVSGSPASLGSSITLNIPDASESVRGVVTKDAQTFGGLKTFGSTPKITPFSTAGVVHNDASGQLSSSSVVLASTDVSGVCR